MSQDHIQTGHLGTRPKPLKAKAGAYVMLYSRQVARIASEDHIK